MMLLLGEYIGTSDFLIVLMSRDIGARQGQVHWKVRWVDQPEFGHFLILFF